MLLKGGDGMAFTHKAPNGKTYTLHELVVKLRGSGVKQTIYYFSPKGGKGSINELPKGYKIMHSRRTGLPMLKKS